MTVNLYRKEVSADQISGRLIASGPFVVLSVTDTGHGMNEDTRLRVFEPYFTTKEVGRGTGLGMAVIHGIVEDYKGFIEVESTPGEGSTFSVYLPAIDAVSEQEITTKLTMPQGTERVLVVDDESSLVALQKTILERLGYIMTATTDSREALNKISHNPDQFDLLITDQTMPYYSGIDLAEEVLKIKPSMPIILCTGYSSVASDERKTLAMGIKRYLKKPVNRTTLANTVREVLDEEKNSE